MCKITKKLCIASLLKYLVFFLILLFANDRLSILKTWIYSET